MVKGRLGAGGLVLEVKADEVPELFVKAGKLLEREMVELKGVRRSQTRKINLQAKDLKELLYKFLSDLIYLKETYGLVFSGFSVVYNAGVVSMSGQLAGERVERGRHKLKRSVKSVSQEGFRVEREARGWRATIPLNV